MIVRQRPVEISWSVTRQTKDAYVIRSTVERSFLRNRSEITTPLPPSPSKTISHNVVPTLGSKQKFHVLKRT